jgi:hypothetical protein
MGNCNRTPSELRCFKIIVFFSFNSTHHAGSRDSSPEALVPKARKVYNKNQNARIETFMTYLPA